MIRDHVRGPEADSQPTQPASAVRRAKPCPALRARMIRDHERDPEADSQRERRENPALHCVHACRDHVRGPEADSQ
eukprot:scaffold110221_cov74-Phaeocystis_antarctica.AAC.1